jgi:hypothetical protein
MDDLSTWMWDVVIDIIEYEAEHAKGERCIESTFVRIPEDVRQTAVAPRSYRADFAATAERESKR